MGIDSLNSRLSGYLIFRYAGTCSPVVLWQWLLYRSQVLYVQFPNQTRIIVLPIIGNRLTTLWVLSVRKTPAPWFARPIRVVGLRRILSFCSVAGILIHSVMVSHIAIL